MDIFDFYRFCQSEFLNKITKEDKLLNDKFFSNNDITVPKIVINCYFPVLFFMNLGFNSIINEK